MNQKSAETAVVSSALIVGGIYAYRKLVEGSIPPNTNRVSVDKKGKLATIAGYGDLPPIGQFITGWGFAFTVMALLSQFAPSFGGSLAILVATGDVLGNGLAVSQDVNDRIGGKNSTVSTDYPTESASGGPIMQPGETHQHYDERVYQWLISHPPTSTIKTDTRTQPTITTNPFTGSPPPILAPLG